VCIVGLLGVVALGIDGGELQRQRRLAQNAADAAALAGAQEILRVHSDDEIFGAAIQEATRNGFTTGVNGKRVITTHPVSPDYFTGNAYIKVVIEDTVRTMFAGIIGRKTVVVKARAWGGIVAPSNFCMAILDPSAGPAMILETGADVTASNCGVSINSTSSTALAVGGGSVLTAGTLTVTGGIDNDGSIVATTKTGVAATPDPLAYVQMPSYSATCDYTKVDITSVRTLNPGVYCGDDKDAAIWVHGNSANATLNPGLYVLMGGGLRVSNGARITGTGVSFLNTNGVGNVAKSFGVFNFETAAIANLSAMTSGALSGILFYQDPSAGQSGTLYVNQFQTAGSSVFTGSMYFPTQKVWFHTGAAFTVTGGLVAKQVRVSQSNTSVTFTGMSGGGTGYFGLKRATLVE
jgi:hypothetical protein